MMLRATIAIRFVRRAERRISAIEVRAGRSRPSVRASSMASRRRSSNSSTLMCSREMRARPSGRGTSVTPAIRFSAATGLVTMTARPAYLDSSAGALGTTSATTG
jgi:Flp pilus assembly protein TadB